MTVVKVKVSIDPPTVVLVELPKGYRRVWRGALCPGDLSLNMQAAREGFICWDPVKIPTRRQMRKRCMWAHANWFACLIRVGQGEVDKTCEECETAPAPFDHRYCVLCQVKLRSRRYA